MGDFGGGKGGREKGGLREEGRKKGLQEEFAVSRIIVQFGCMLGCFPKFENSNMFFIHKVIL